MQILHLDGFSHDELMQQKPLVFFNIIDSCQKLLRAAKNLGIEIELSEVRFEMKMLLPLTMFVNHDMFAMER